MVNRSILAYHVVGAHLGAYQGKGLKGLVATVLGRVVNDHKIRFPEAEIGGPHPIWRRGGMNLTKAAFSGMQHIA